jgi:hypothetical protein
MLRHRASGPDVSKERAASDKLFRNVWKVTQRRSVTIQKTGIGRGIFYFLSFFLSLFFYLVYA